MRRFLQHNRWATLLVVGFFMLATSGLALSRMTCLMGGPSVLSIGAMEDCCPEHGPSESATFTADCCDLATVQSSAQNYLPHEDLDFAPVLLALDATPRLLLSVGTSLRTTATDSRPPPLLGTERLVFFSVQRV